MEEKYSQLRVIRRDRDGRCRYHQADKRALVEACLRPGVSVARQAQENGINANLLRKWIARYLLERERASASAVPAKLVLEPQTDSPLAADTMPMTARPSVAAGAAPAAFIPIVQAPAATAAASSAQPASPSMALALHVRLPNGVQFDLDEANLEALSRVVQMLGRLPCSGSTQD